MPHKAKRWEQSDEQAEINENRNERDERDAADQISVRFCHSVARPARVVLRGIRISVSRDEILALGRLTPRTTVCIPQAAVDSMYSVNEPSKSIATYPTHQHVD